MFTQIGYGLIADGKPVGTWPVSLSYAQKAAKRYETLKDRTHKHTQIVPVFFDQSNAIQPDKGETAS